MKNKICRWGGFQLRWALCALLFVFLLATNPQTGWAQGSPVIRTITVEGNQRVEPETVQSYIGLGTGDQYDEQKVDQALKTLFATGLFSDVKIRLQGNALVVTVVENPIINRVAFEGNRRLNDERLGEETEVKPRQSFTRARVQADVQRIIEVYRRAGRFAATVEAKTIQLEQNRVDLIYEITEGPITNIGKISFVGNEVFSDGRLRRVVSTRQSRFYAFLRSADVYDPDRLTVDAELLRRFYLSRGYADFQVVSTSAELSPDNSTFFITFTVSEGERYKFGPATIQTNLQDVDQEVMQGLTTFNEGDFYNAEEIDNTIDAISFYVGGLGFAFARVRPRVERDRENLIINSTFTVEEGPRVYVERINIKGNSRTLDRVVRREFRLIEGDAYSQRLVEASRRRIRGLDYFSKVDVTREPGSAPDKAVINVELEEKATGELSFGAGFSSSEGLVGDINITERNLLGRGQFLRFGVSGSAKRLQGDIKFTEPRFRDRNLAAGFDIFRIITDLEEESGFQSDDTGLRLRAGFPLSEFSNLSLDYTIRQDSIEVDQAQCGVGGTISLSICEDEGTELISSVGYTYFLDRRDDPLFPTGGFDFQFKQELAGLGGTVDYLSTEIRGRAYKSLGRDDVVASLEIDTGYIESFTNDRIRSTDRFRKGGASFKGFKFAGIGPHDTSTGDALGGKAFAITTLELLFPLGLPQELGMRGAVFTQAGTVGLLDDKDLGTLVNPNDVEDDLSARVSVGVSLLWRSPVGPVRVDLSKALVKEDYDETEDFRFGASTRF